MGPLPFGVTVLCIVKLVVSLLSNSQGIINVKIQTGDLKKIVFHTFPKILALFSKCHISI